MSVSATASDRAEAEPMFFARSKRVAAITVLVALTANTLAQAETKRPRSHAAAKAPSKRRTKGHKKAPPPPAEEAAEEESAPSAAAEASRGRKERTVARASEDTDAEAPAKDKDKDKDKEKDETKDREAKGDGSKSHFDVGRDAKDKPSESLPASRVAAERPISVAPLFGYSSGGFGVGLGARGGYTIPMGGAPGTGLYVGGTFVYHFGFSTEFLGTSVGFSAFYPGGEVGYELRPIDNLAIRPYGGAAVVVATVTGTGLLNTGGSVTAPAFAIYPGCAITYDIPNTPAFVGADARLLVVFGGSANFGAFLTGGMRF